MVPGPRYGDALHNQRVHGVPSVAKTPILSDALTVWTTVPALRGLVEHRFGVDADVGDTLIGSPGHADPGIGVHDETQVAGAQVLSHASAILTPVQTLELSVRDQGGPKPERDAPLDSGVPEGLWIAGADVGPDAPTIGTPIGTAVLLVQAVHSKRDANLGHGVHHEPRIAGASVGPDALAIGTPIGTPELLLVVPSSRHANSGRGVHDVPLVADTPVGPDTSPIGTSVGTLDVVEVRVQGIGDRGGGVPAKGGDALPGLQVLDVPGIADALVGTDALPVGTAGGTLVALDRFALAGPGVQAVTRVADALVVPHAVAVQAAVGAVGLLDVLGRPRARRVGTWDAGPGAWVHVETAVADAVVGPDAEAVRATVPAEGVDEATAAVGVLDVAGSADAVAVSVAVAVVAAVGALRDAGLAVLAGVHVPGIRGWKVGCCRCLT